MFLAVRELKFAKGRFSLIVTVVALMTLLVGFLTGLTGGLASQNISALLRTGADQVVFASPEGEQRLSYAESTLSQETVAQWQQVPGLTATPLSIVNGAVHAGDNKKALVLFAGVDPDGAAQPSGSGITLGAGTAAELGVSIGDTVTVAGLELTVTAVTGDEYYSHREVAWVSLETAHQFAQRTRQDAAYAGVLLVHHDAAARELAAPAVSELSAASSGVGGTAVNAATRDAAAESVSVATATTVTGLWASLAALESFKSEVGSLGMMIGMLLLIATLVIGVFFLVWSMQRQRDIAVLKALGAKTSWLVRDSLGQALLVLLLGVLLGATANFLLGAVVSQALPFVAGIVPVAVPAVLLVIAGLAGALVSLRQIVRADPNSALQAAGV